MSFEKFEARYSREFEVIIDCFSSYIEFKIEAKASTIWQPKNGLVLEIASKKREENFMEFLAINSVVSNTKLLFPKHSRCGIVCKVAKFCPLVI